LQLASNMPHAVLLSHASQIASNITRRPVKRKYTNNLWSTFNAPEPGNTQERNTQITEYTYTAIKD